MKFLLVHVPNGHRPTVDALVANLLQESAAAEMHWLQGQGERDTLLATVPESALQKLLDALQRQLQGSDTARVHVLPVEASVPEVPTGTAPVLTREVLGQLARSGAQSDRWFALLVALSTLVAALGLIRDNVAVIIGAMVIAPLLGPNLSFTLATALGDQRTALLALRTLLLGTALGFLVALCVALSWPTFPVGDELMSRTTLTFDSALLALAAGLAAVLSMTRGLSSTLVGVMVAVALIPPLATSALFLGRDYPGLAGAALAVFAVNVAAINLAAHAAFEVMGVAPRSGGQARTARRRAWLSMALWGALLVVLLWMFG